MSSFVERYKLLPDRVDLKVTRVEPAGVRVGVQHVPGEHRRSVQTDGDGVRLKRYYDPVDYDGRLRRDIRSKPALCGEGVNRGGGWLNVFRTRNGNHFASGLPTQDASCGAYGFPTQLGDAAGSDVGWLRSKKVDVQIAADFVYGMSFFSRF